MRNLRVNGVNFWDVLTADVLALRWSTIGEFLRSPLARAASLVPVAGYIVLYSEQFQSIFRFPEISTHAWFTPFVRALLIYVGGLLILGGALVYRARAPAMIRNYSNGEESRRTFLREGSRHDLIAAMENYFSGMGTGWRRGEFSNNLTYFSNVLIEDHWTRVAQVMLRQDSRLSVYKDLIENDTVGLALAGDDKNPFAAWWSRIIHETEDIEQEPTRGVFLSSARLTAESYKKHEPYYVVRGLSEVTESQRSDPLVWNLAGGVIEAHYELLNSTKETERLLLSIILVAGGFLITLPGLETFVRVILIPVS